MRGAHNALPIALRNVSKTYDGPAGGFPALRGIDLEIPAGDLALIVGKSGSGKSTLLNLMAGIDRPSAGSVSIGQTALEGLSHNQLAAFRGRTVGIVFQFFQLLPTLTAAENVMLPMDFRGTFSVRERRSRALSLLDRAGVLDQADKLPSTLSGGQQQRVAIARALANDPPIVLADEPTGNLDSATGAAVFQLLFELSKEGKTLVIVTHEREAMAEWMGGARTITIADGSVA